ncbi:GlsB/YeaQ/YmgE family stress response membrane protein [Bradyrhizobium sp. AZCC 2289]|uniref:GlsB/YeaQ/YmgE family stress response membrane protein n=1 Tax=Bradyrhizobium sp. AZCC 2289 TaxID=3117026 RepID=UPI002FEE88CC
MGGIIWVIIVGFVAGIIARMLSPGPNNPTGFVLTTILGIVGAALATYVGQKLGYYAEGQGATGAGFITATIGALVVLFIWNRLVARGVIPDMNK